MLECVFWTLFIIALAFAVLWMDTRESRNRYRRRADEAEAGRQSAIAEMDRAKDAANDAEVLRAANEILRHQNGELEDALGRANARADAQTAALTAARGEIGRLKQAVSVYRERAEDALRELPEVSP